MVQNDEESDAEEAKEAEGDPLESRAAFKQLLIKTLEDNEMDKKRAAKMEIIDFLTVLNAMNQVGIHFS